MARKSRRFSAPDEVLPVSAPARTLFWKAMGWHMHHRPDGQKYVLNQAPHGFPECYAETASVLLNGD